MNFFYANNRRDGRAAPRVPNTKRTGFGAGGDAPSIRRNFDTRDKTAHGQLVAQRAGANIVNLGVWIARRHEPRAVGAERSLPNLVWQVDDERLGALGAEIPKTHRVVNRSSGQRGAIRGDTGAVDASEVFDSAGQQFAILEITHLNHTCARGNNQALVVIEEPKVLDLRKLPNLYIDERRSL